MKENTQKRCPMCNSDYPYQDGSLWICPECSHEWSATLTVPNKPKELVIRDANGTILCDGDSVTVIKDLKVKGSSSPIKVGTKVKNIRLNPDGPDGHDIFCRIDGFGAINLKSKFVKKL